MNLPTSKPWPRFPAELRQPGWFRQRGFAHHVGDDGRVDGWAFYERGVEGTGWKVERRGMPARWVVA